MAARIIEVRNGLAAVVRTAINASPATVLTKLWADRDLEQVKERSVYLFTDGWSQPDAADRANDFTDYRIRIVTVNRHRGQIDSRESWAESELDWVDTYLWPLTDARRAFLLDSLWCQSAEVVTDYDADWLLEKGVFFNEILTVWREAA